MDRISEREELDRADLHIVQAESRLTAQEETVRRFQEEGHDTREAERLLDNLRATLEQLYIHRRAINEALDKASPRRSYGGN